MIKKEFSANDAQPVILYAKTDQNLDTAVPLACTTTGSLLLAASGDVPSGTTDSGNPIKTGGIAKQTNPTPVADGQRVGSLYDDVGRQVVTLSIRDLKVVQQTNITSTTSTIVLASASALFLDVYGCVISNGSGTTCTITIKDDTTTRFVITVPANDVRGFVLTESAAVAQAAVTKNWNASLSVAVTSVDITMLAVKNV